MYRCEKVRITLLYPAHTLRCILTGLFSLWQSSVPSRSFRSFQSWEHRLRFYAWYFPSGKEKQIRFCWRYCWWMYLSNSISIWLEADTENVWNTFSLSRSDFFTCKAVFLWSRSSKMLNFCKLFPLLQFYIYDLTYYPNHFRLLNSFYLFLIPSFVISQLWNYCRNLFSKIYDRNKTFIYPMVSG